MSIHLHYTDPRVAPNVARIGQITLLQAREAELRLWLNCRAHAAPIVVEWLEAAIADCRRMLGLAQTEQAAS